MEGIMSNRGKRYSAELKDEVFHDLVVEGKSIQAVSEAYGIGTQTLYHWRRSHHSSVSSDERSELEVLGGEHEQLQRSYCELEQERDILKKAVGYFAKK